MSENACTGSSAKIPHPQAVDKESARARPVGGRRPTTQPSGTNEKFDFGSSESLGTKEKGRRLAVIAETGARSTENEWEGTQDVTGAPLGS